MANCRLSFVQPVDFHWLRRINSALASTSMACFATSGAAIDPLRRPSTPDPKVQCQSEGADRLPRNPRWERYKVTVGVSYLGIQILFFRPSLPRYLASARPEMAGIVEHTNDCDKRKIGRDQTHVPLDLVTIAIILRNIHD